MFRQSKKDSLSFLKEQVATLDDLNDLLERKLRNEKNLRTAAEQVIFKILRGRKKILVNGRLSE